VRIPTAIATTAAAGVVLWVSWQAGVQGPGATTAGGVHVIATAPPVTGTPTPGGRGKAAATTPAKRAGASQGATSRQVIGAVVGTRYGDVQVKIVVSGTRIRDVVALHLTDSSDTSVQISAGAAPTLRSEALAAQSANIDLVSGATYTSEGYKQSLQAAIDAAHL
jgi:uncharacterized protein with FMN-binding domain